MSASETRLRELRARAADERADLADALVTARESLAAARHRWRFAGWAASGAAAAAMAGWQLFGRNSLAAKVSRIASYASLALGVGRGVSRLRKFW
jgi:hypothetical protein